MTRIGAPTLQALDRTGDGVLGASELYDDVLGALDADGDGLLSDGDLLEIDRRIRPGTPAAASRELVLQRQAALEQAIVARDVIQEAYTDSARRADRAYGGMVSSFCALSVAGTILATTGGAVAAVFTGLGAVALLGFLIYFLVNFERVAPSALDVQRAQLTAASTAAFCARRDLQKAIEELGRNMRSPTAPTPSEPTSGGVRLRRSSGGQSTS